MIGRLRTRDEFERLRRAGRRVRSEPLWCSHVADPTLSETRLAFAIGRPIGNAVVRNRLRRRLRALVAECDRAGRLPTGLLLVGARPDAVELTFDQLRSSVDRLVTRLDGVTSMTAPRTPTIVC